MRKINEKIFTVVLVCALVVMALVQISISEVIDELSSASQSSIQTSNEATDMDVKGFAIVLGTGITAFSAFFTVAMYCLSAGFVVIVLIYLALYLIPFVIFNKKESKTRLIISYVLYFIALVIQLGITFILFSIAFYGGSINILILIATIAEIISILTPIIMYLLNQEEIKRVYNIDKEIGENK